jgi:hypothetical protein
MKIAGQIIKNSIVHMEWGEFLDPKISPYGYNETMANLFFPLEKSEAIALGYTWNDYVTPDPDAKKYIPASLLPMHIDDVPIDVLNWAIKCEVS